LKGGLNHTTIKAEHHVEVALCFRDKSMILTQSAVIITTTTTTTTTTTKTTTATNKTN
jgi:hypothetical protein